MEGRQCVVSCPTDVITGQTMSFVTARYAGGRTILRSDGGAKMMLLF